MGKETEATTHAGIAGEAEQSFAKSPLADLARYVNKLDDLPVLRAEAEAGLAEASVRLAYARLHLRQSREGLLTTGSRRSATI
jgi:hypothetical protein